MAVRPKKRQTIVRRKRRAVTADVLGPRPKAERIPSKWRKQYLKLLQLRRDLSGRQAGLNKDARAEAPVFSSHMADAGTDTYDRDLALGMLSSEQEAIYEIEEALRRIHNGTYGICELTGKRI